MSFYRCTIGKNLSFCYFLHQLQFLITHFRKSNFLLAIQSPPFLFVPYFVARFHTSFQGLFSLYSHHSFCTNWLSTRKKPQNFQTCKRRNKTYLNYKWKATSYTRNPIWTLKKVEHFLRKAKIQCEFRLITKNEIVAWVLVMEKKMVTWKLNGMVTS